MPQDPNAAALSNVLYRNPAMVQQPATAMALAYSSAKDDDLSIMNGALRGKQIMDALNSVPGTEQLKYWEKMDANDRRMAIASGYALPIDAHEVEHQNALEKGFGKALGFVGKFTPNAVEKPLKGAVQAYSNVVENTVQRGMRSVILAAGDEEDSWGAFNVFDVGSWGRWWDAADKDNAPLEPHTEARIRDKYGDGMVDLLRTEQQKPGFLNSEFARLISEGQTDQAAQLDEIMRSEDFGKAFNEMENARISVGRLLPQMVGMLPGEWNDLEANETMFNVISGPIDAAWRLGTDPLNRLTTGNPGAVGPRVLPANPITDTLASKNLIAARRSAYAIPAFDDAKATAAIEDAFSGSTKQSQNVIRYFDDMGKHMETIRQGGTAAGDAMHQLRKNFKATMPLYDQMVKWKAADGTVVKDAATAKQFLLEEKNYRHILSGNKANPRGLMPYRSAFQQRWQNVKPGSVIDWLEDGDKLVRDSLEEAAGQIGDTGVKIRRSDFAHVGSYAGKDAQDAAFAAAKEQQANLIGNAAEGLRSQAGARVSEHTGKVVTDWTGINPWRQRAATAFRRLNTPTLALNEKGQLNLLGEDATEQVHRLARYYGPKFWADQVAAAFSRTDDIVVRKNIVKGLLQTQAEATGLLKSVEGREWMSTYLRNIDDSVKGTYSVTNAGVLNTGERSAWMLEDARPHVSLPSFKEFHAQAAKVGVTKNVWGIANRDLVDNFMSTVWRPMMLLRPATAQRNAIDEMANALVRNGGGNFVTARAELRLANKAQYDARQAAKAKAGAASTHADDLEAAFKADFADDAAYSSAVAQLEQEVKDLKNASRRAYPTATTGQHAAKRAELKALKSRKQELAKAKEEAQILHARYKGTANGIDPTAGRLYRMYANSAGFLVKKAATLGHLQDSPFMLQLEHHARLETAHDLYMTHVYGKLSDTWIKHFADDKAAFRVQYIKDLVDDPFFRSRLEEDMIGSARDSLSESVRAMDDLVARPGTKNPRRWVQVGNPKAMHPLDDAGARSWSQRNNKMADNELGHLAMLYLDDEAKAVEMVANAIRSNGEHAAQLRKVRETPPEEMAAQIVAEVKAHFSRADGTLNKPLVKAMIQDAGGVRTLNRDAFSPENLNKFKTADRPDKIVARDGALVEEGRTLADLIQNGFTFFGEMTAYMSRHPQMVDEYLNARMTLEGYEGALKDRFTAAGMTEEKAAQLAKEQAHSEAVTNATNKVIQYIDNPAVRSQAAVIFRNIAPFYRAQEEFFRRWARTMKYSPEMFARANLYLDGAQNTGWFWKDDEGTQYFTYPGTKVLSEAMSKVGSTFGIPMDILPVPVPMTGQVNMLAPGFQTGQWTKVFNGPIHSIPVAVMETMTGSPTLREFQRQAYGDVAVGQNPILGLTPSVIRPAVDAVLNRKEVMFAAQKQAIAYLAANNDPDMEAMQQGDLVARQRFLEKVRRHSLGVVITKALIAPNVPASPRAGSANAPTTPFADPASQAEGLRFIDDKYWKLVERVGHDEAYAYWVKEHPDELPFLTGSTEGESAAFLPMTTKAFEFMDENREIMTRYKKAASFLVPQETDKNKNMQAWQLAMDLGIRKFKDVNTFIDDVLIANDLSHYYDQSKEYNRQLMEAKAAGVSATPIRTAWSDWRNQWLPFHPLVKEEIENGFQRQQRREDTLEEFRQMLNDPEVPPSPALEKMRNLVQQYSQMQMLIAPIKSNRDDASVAQKEQYRAAFQEWAEQYTADEPGARMMFQRVFSLLDD